MFTHLERVVKHLPTDILRLSPSFVTLSDKMNSHFINQFISFR
jgi:hypothetical protein